MVISSPSDRPIVLCFVPYYLPGFRSGGPVRSISNLVDHLGDEIDFLIVTSDRDLHDLEPYPGVAIDSWNRVGKAQVFYASPQSMWLGPTARLMRETTHDVLYLNSFFAFTHTTLPLLARRLGLAPQRPCVIAPRGEFSAGALALKSGKKALYRHASGVLNLYADLIWQASSRLEADEIRLVMGSVAECIKVAPDLLVHKPSLIHQPAVSSQRAEGNLRIVFLSRITPKKNLDFLLQVLINARVSLDLSIYGPVEDLLYWRHCQALIARLPPVIHCQYCGELKPEDVYEAFSSHDLFVFPTRGENYGHVVPEALSVGTCLLLSDQTPWPSDDLGCINVLSLNRPDSWTAAIESWSLLSLDQLLSRRASAQQYYARLIADNFDTLANRVLFQSASFSGS